MNKKISLAILLFPVIIISCNKTDSSSAPSSSEWSIPREEVFDGGPGKDGIPALDNPESNDPSSISFMKDNDLIIGFKEKNEVKGYPHPILDWHEIINDDVSGKKVAITFCPLTGTAIAWQREINGKTTTFGVSGLLYNNNQIPYDRATNSNWAQMKSESVNGELIGEKIGTYPIIETTWKTWLEMYPQAKVVGANTGFSRPYGNYPYINRQNQDYREVNSYILFPVTNDDNRLPAKDRVLGVIINEAVKAYPLKSFGNTETTLIKDAFQGEDLVLAGNQTKNFMVAYKSRLADNTLLNFSPVQNSLPIIMKDQEGNQWDIFGFAISGPRTGERLLSVYSYIGYWFSWAPFYPDVELFN